MKHSFRSFTRNQQHSLSPEEQSKLDQLSRLAAPYAHMSEEEILRQLHRLSADPKVAQFLQGQNLTELSSRLAPYLSGAQQQKLASILRRFKT